MLKINFSQDLDFIFAFQYATELQQLKSEMNIALKKTNGTNHAAWINAGNLKYFEFVNDLVKQESAYKFMNNVQGTPHAHCLLWVKDAPVIGDEQDDEKVCSFVDKYVHGRIPDDRRELAESRHLVMKLKSHSHSSYCRAHVNAKCRFNFPKPPTMKTIVARQLQVNETSEINMEENKEIMRLVHENIAKDSSLTLEEILEKECISEERYLECLKLSSNHGSGVVL